MHLFSDCPYMKILDFQGQQLFKASKLRRSDLRSVVIRVLLTFTNRVPKKTASLLTHAQLTIERV